jgi:hypothetical protein
MPSIHPRHTDVVNLRSPQTGIVSDTEKEKDVNDLLVSVPMENSPRDDHPVHEVIPNHQSLATVRIVEKMKDIFISLKVDGTRTIRLAIRRARRRMANADFIQSIKLIYSMSPVCTVLMDVFLAFGYIC